MTFSNYFSGSAMGIKEDFNFNMLSRGNFSQEEEYRENKNNESIKNKEKLFDIKSKVGLSKGLSPDMFKTSNFSLSQFNIKGGGHMTLKNKANNVKDLLSISPSKHTNKANTLMFMNSRKTGKSLDVSKYLPNSKNKTSRSSPVNINQFLGTTKTKNNNISKMLGSGKSTNVSKMLGSGKSTNVNKFLGIKIKNKYGKVTSKRVLKPKITIGQYAGLSNKPFGDYDGDGVKNILDCEPKNFHRQGFFDRFKKQKPSSITVPSQPNNIEYENYPEYEEQEANDYESDAREEVKSWGTVPEEHDKAIFTKGYITGKEEQEIEDEQGFWSKTGTAIGSGVKSVGGEVASRIKTEYKRGKEIRSKRHQQLKKQIPFQIATERELRKARELARIKEQYGYAPGYEGYDKDTKTGKRGRPRKSQPISGKKQSPINEVRQAMSAGFGGGNEDTLSKIKHFTGNDSGSSGLALMSGVNKQPAGPTGFQLAATGQQNYSQLPQTYSSKVQSLMGTSKFTPPEPQQPPSLEQVQAIPDDATVQSPYSKRPVTYVRGPYKKKQIVYVQSQE